MSTMLSAGCMYHVYNRANGFESLFREEKNHIFFLRKLKEHIGPVARIFGWCMLDNHFHVMVRIRSEDEIQNHLGREVVLKFGTIEKLCSKQFSNFFSSYTQSYNKVYRRRGSLFQPSMKRKKVDSMQYCMQLLLYIHHNAVKHGFVKHFLDWPHSSWWQYRDTLTNTSGVKEDTRIITAEIREEVFRWFGGEDAFVAAHRPIG